MICIVKVKCPFCNKLLIKADYIKGEIKCSRCKRLINIKIEKPELRATP
ncbi:Com family DNA-binding transcriptional regulator [Clostridium sp. UBA7503]